LLVVGDTRELGGGAGLVESDVHGTEGTLGKVHDGGMYAETVERPRTRKRELRVPAALLPPKPGTLLGPDELFLLIGLRTQPLVSGTLGIGVELLDGGIQKMEVVADPIDLLCAHQAVEEHPAMVSPGVDLGVSGSS
jgi:hypothetical protein